MELELTALLPVLMFICLLTLLMTGYPVAFTLAGTALIFGLIGHFCDVFYLSDLGFIPNRIFGIISNFTLVAVPLFVFMGLTLEKSGIAEDLLNTFSKWFSSFKGSLAIAVVMVGAVLAASTGIVGATVVTMGVLSLPTMLDNGYSKRLSTGTIAASGTLGQIIPPSIVLVLLGSMLNVDVGDLFIGAIIPGVMLVLFYLLYIIIAVRIRPDLAPAATKKETVTWQEIARTILPPAALMAIVLGSILLGVASPTEAAACGAAGAVVIAWLKKRMNWQQLIAISEHTSRITAMVFLILVGAQFFGVVFRGLEGETLITDTIAALSLDPAFVLFGIMLMIFVLGFFLDFLEICFIVIPIIMPIFIELEFDLLWIGIMIAINLQTSFLTPPFGFSLFYLKGVAPEGVKTTDIYRGVVPFVAIQAFTLLLIALFPGLVIWLPRFVFGD